MVCCHGSGYCPPDLVGRGQTHPEDKNSATDRRGENKDRGRRRKELHFFAKTARFLAQNVLPCHLSYCGLPLPPGSRLLFRMAIPANRTWRGASSPGYRCW